MADDQTARISLRKERRHDLRLQQAELEASMEDVDPAEAAQVLAEVGVVLSSSDNESPLSTVVQVKMFFILCN